MELKSHYILSPLPQVEGMSSKDRKIRLKFTKHLREITKRGFAPIKDVIDEGALPLLFDSIISKRSTAGIQDEALQFEATWILINISGESNEIRNLLVEAGVIPLLNKLLKLASPAFRFQAIAALGTIAGGSSYLRDTVLESNCLSTICELTQRAQTGELTFLRAATSAILSLCKGKPCPQFKYTKIVLPTLVTLLINVSDEAVLIDVSWSLTHITDGENESIQAVVESYGVLKRLVDLLSSSSILLLQPVLRTLGNIVTGNDSQTQKVLEANVLPKLKLLLGHSNERLSKEVCWTISNIAGGNDSQVQAIINADIFPTLLKIIENISINIEIRREAAWALSNANSVGREQVEYLVKIGCIPVISSLITNEKNKSLATIGLQGMKNILNVGLVRKNEEKLKDNFYLTHFEDCQCGIDKMLDLKMDCINLEASNLADDILVVLGMDDV